MQAESTHSENVGACTLEERSHALVLYHLRTTVNHVLVVNLLAAVCVCGQGEQTDGGWWQDLAGRGGIRIESKVGDTARPSDRQRESSTHEVIIIRLRMVSSGYEAIPAPVVTPQPSRNEARKLPWRLPTRMTGFKESYMPK